MLGEIIAPETPVASTPDTPAEARPFDPADSTVLIVDDNEPNLELLQAYLGELKCRTLLARDGAEALEQFRNASPDLVLLDIMMPRMSGFQVCEAIRRDEGETRTPVLMVTALNQVADVERALEAGADEFLTKPVDRRELLVRVQSQLKIHHLRRELRAARAEVAHLRDQSTPD
ncbi:MAG: response regulator [Phycisphaerales bacterium]|nr:response regulator [Phycisphaerales bacterium]